MTTLNRAGGRNPGPPHLACPSRSISGSVAIFDHATLDGGEQGDHGAMKENDVNVFNDRYPELTQLFNKVLQS